MLKGKRTYIIMAVALGCGLFQQFVGSIPMADPKLFGIIVPLIGLYMRYISTGKAPSILEMLSAGKDLLGLSTDVQEAIVAEEAREARESKEGDAK